MTYVAGKAVDILVVSSGATTPSDVVTFVPTYEEITTGAINAQI